jgi:hypothetical protein
VKETSLEKKLRLRVKKAGGVCIKLPAFLYRGIPDRLVLLPLARIYFVEMKADNGKTSTHQTRWMKLLSKLGFESVIIKGATNLENFLNDLKI